MRFARHLLLATLAFGAAACSDDDLGPTRTVVPPLAYVRYINATPDTLNHTVRWVDDIEFTPQTFVNVAFRDMGQGGWQGLRSGSRHFKIFTYQQNTLNFPVAGNTTVLKDTTFNFETGKYYTILYTGFTRTGSTPAAQLRIFEDEPVASPAAGTMIRVFNVSYGLEYDAYLGRQAAYLDTLSGPDTTITVDTTYFADGPTIDTTITVDTAITYTTASREVNGEMFTIAELGTLIGTARAATVGTVTQAYAARATGTYAVRLTLPGDSVSRGFRLIPPAGLAETADFEAAGGVGITGSVLTAWLFDRKPAGTAGAGAANATPTVLWTIDRSPARTIAP